VTKPFDAHRSALLIAFSRFQVDIHSSVFNFYHLTIGPADVQ